MSKYIITSLGLLASLGAPFFAGADQGWINDRYIVAYKDLIIGTIDGVLVPALGAVALITFFWGVYKYFIAPDGEKEEGRHFVLWGIIGFVVIFSVWGLVKIAQTTLIPSSAENATMPRIPTL